jgi:hypothetical protein
MPRDRFEPAPVGKADFALFVAALLRRHRTCSDVETAPDAIASTGSRDRLTVLPRQPSQKQNRPRSDAANAGGGDAVDHHCGDSASTLHDDRNKIKSNARS